MIYHMERNPKPPGAEVRVRSGSGKSASPFRRRGGEAPVPRTRQHAWNSCERKCLRLLLTRYQRKEISTKENEVGYGQDSESSQTRGRFLLLETLLAC